MRINKHNSRAVLAAFIVLLVGGFSVLEADLPLYPASDNAGEFEHLYVPDEVIVLLKSPSHTDSFDDASLERKGIRGRVVRKLKLPRTQQGVLRVKLVAGQTVAEAIGENWSRKDPRILRVEPNYRLYTLGTPNDPYFGHQWALSNYGQTGGTIHSDINATQAWDITTGSSEIIVAVIDTGVDYTHPDLAGQMWINEKELNGVSGADDDGNGYIDDIYGYDFVQNNNDPFDENGHGTHCAGIIAAAGSNGLGIAGVSWNTRIMICRFLDARGSGTVANAIEAINYAVANGARILNNSWGGGGYSVALETAIRNAENHGVLFVAAAGNTSTNNDIYPQYPASYTLPNLISVAASDHRDALSSFSCYGKQTVHLAAPGTSILSTVPGGYAWYSGTSMAAPHVSGTAALLLAMNPSMSVSELKDRLMWSGDPVSSHVDKTISGRRLNAYNALTAENSLRLLTPTQSSLWSSGFAYTIKWIAIGSDAPINLLLLKNDQVVETLALNLTHVNQYVWNIPADLPAGDDYAVLIDDGTLNNISNRFSITADRVDFYTELFTREQNRVDLSNKSVLFVPVGTTRFEAVTQDIASLPIFSKPDKRLRLGDDDAALVVLAENSFPYFGREYDRLYVGSNGYITFDAPDNEYRVRLDTHFSMPRISALFYDLDPSAGGGVFSTQMNDRVVITWLNVPVFARPVHCTFQAELFFDGKIRLSWLDIPNVKCLVGFSRGGGQPQDFLISDISEYTSYSPKLEFIHIDGPAHTRENEVVQLTCTGYYEYGITRDLTHYGNLNWTSSPEPFWVNPSGEVFAENTLLFHHLEVSAELDGAADNFGIFIKGQNTEAIDVFNCTVSVGNGSGNDRISLIGALSLPIETLEQADMISVKLWSSRNECIVHNTYEATENMLKKGIYTARKKSDGDPGGSVQQLRIDSRKGLLRYALNAADLNGLDNPAYITIECGDYAGVGQLNAANVNKGRSMPSTLMAGIDDTLQIHRVQFVNSTARQRDQIRVDGQFSLRQPVVPAGDITLSLNSQNFVLPAEYSSMKKDRQLFRYTTPCGQRGQGLLNFKSGLFRIAITRTDIAVESDRVEVGLHFDDFSLSQKIDI